MKNTVLITGASSGIGYELAKVFGVNSYNLILVSRNTDKLKSLAHELIKEHGISVEVISEDLSKSESAERLYNKVKQLNLEVDILINNAGVGEVGYFHEISISKDLEMMQLNIVTLTELTKFFSRDMVNRKNGKILNVASTGAFSPGPYTAVYYATKAYVLSLSEALNKELREHNVVVSALCPGATKTNFAKRAGKKDTPVAMDPSKVAKAAYEGIKHNKRIIIPGIENKILVRLPKNIVSEMNFKNQKKLAFKIE